MAEFNVTIEILSPIHLGSGGGDVNIDAQIIHDAFGLPYFPAKTFKGLLHESAVEVREMFELAKIKNIPLPDLDKLFHKKSSDNGAVENSRLIVPNFYLYPFDEYKKICDEWKYLQNEYPETFTPSDVLSTFTSIRYQTKLEDGVAADGSLHNMRVLDAGIKFCGKIILTGCDEADLNLLALAIRNLSAAGTKRNRGFGKVRCTSELDGRIEKIFKGRA